MQHDEKAIMHYPRAKATGERVPATLLIGVLGK
jgi:hypothetical protein